MKRSQAWLCYFSVALVMTMPVTVVAQSWYAGAGLGAAFLLNDQPAVVTKTRYLATSGVVGVEWGSPIGLRLEGTETSGFLWLSLDLTYRLGPRSLPVHPYALAGAGFRMDLDNADPISTAGAGLRANVSGPLSLYGEGRVHYVVSGAPVFSYPSIPGTFQARTFFVVTLGISLAP